MLIGTNKFPRSIQLDDHSCAPRCIKSITSFFNKHRTYQDIYNNLHTTTGGTSAIYMVEYLRHLGFKVGMDTQMSVFKLTRSLARGCAVIAFTDLDPVGPHFVVVYGRTRHFIHLSDPDPKTKGKKISMKNFLKRWKLWGITVSI